MNKMIKKQWELTQKRFKFLDADLVDKIKEAYEILEKNNFHGCFNFEDEVYHNGVGMAKGQLDKLRGSPLKFHHNYCVEPELEKSNPLLVGSLIHTAILEPTRLQEKYVSDQAIRLRCGGANPALKKEYKEYKASVEATGRYLIKEEDFDMCFRMVKNVYNHPSFKNILENGVMERCVYAVDSKTGVLLRCKPDRLLIEEGEVLDVKTTKDASLEEFQKSIWNYRYHMGAAFYLYVCSLAFEREFTTYIWGCLEKQKPYDIAIYYADTGCLDKGETEARADIDRFANCLEKDEWNGYIKEIQPISLPYWAFGRE